MAAPRCRSPIEMSLPSPIEMSLGQAVVGTFGMTCDDGGSDERAGADPAARAATRIPGIEVRGHAHPGAEHEGDDRRLPVWARALHNRCGPCSQRHLSLPLLPAIHGLRLPTIHDFSTRGCAPGRDAHFLQCAFRSWWNCLSAVLPELRFRRDKWKRGRSGNSDRLGRHARRPFTLQSNRRVVLRPRPSVASACWSARAVSWNARLGAIRPLTRDLP